MNKRIISKSEMIAVTDAVTGVMETAKLTMIVARDKPKMKDKFSMLFQNSSLAIVRAIKPITSHILFYLIAKCEYGNLVYDSVEDIADCLGYKRNQVSKGLKQLYELNIILKIPHEQDKRRNIIMLHPRQSWRGDALERSKAIQKLLPTQQLDLDLFPEETNNLQKSNKVFPNEIRNFFDGYNANVKNYEGD